MNSFPIINNNLLDDCFSKMQDLYNGDKVKILHASVRATSGESTPFTISATNVDAQLGVIRGRIKRTADKYGQQLMVKIVEELYDDLSISGAIGVSDKDFIDRTEIQLGDNGSIKYTNQKKWFWVWDLNVDGNSRSIELSIRSKALASVDIVPDYILQYVAQAIAAFRNKHHGAAMALMTIALEGTLRDALQFKGITYTPGASSQDVYDLCDIQVHRDPTGYRVVFPNPMPRSHTDYLSAAGDPTFKTFRIKRVEKKGGKFILEIRDTDDLLDYWSSNTVVTHAAIKITGLGAALDISRNTLGILSAIDLPEDLDNPIKTVRNNLIHLSGAAMAVEVQQDANGQPITLKDFLDNKNRVFDAVCTIADTIDSIYNRIADGTL